MYFLSSGVKGIRVICDLTMCCAMKPIITQVDSKETQIPGPGGVPRQSEQVIVVVHVSICHQIHRQH